MIPKFRTNTSLNHLLLLFIPPLHLRIIQTLTNLHRHLGLIAKRTWIGALRILHLQETLRTDGGPAAAEGVDVGVVEEADGAFLVGGLEAIVCSGEPGCYFSVADHASDCFGVPGAAFVET